ATFAWACYQWEFTAIVDGVPASAFGHTTLVFEKRNDVWLIVHNHTSLVQASQTAAPAAQPPAGTPPKSWAQTGLKSPRPAARNSSGRDTQTFRQSPAAARPK